MMSIPLPRLADTAFLIVFGPETVKVSQLPSSLKSFDVEVTCLSASGCFYSLQYLPSPAHDCATTGCGALSRGERVRAHMCYTDDPIDGYV